MESTFNPILQIEDDENYLVLFQRALVGAGISHPLQTVRNGARAIDYLLGQSPFEQRTLYPLPSLIILDLDVPLLNGMEFLAWRQTQPGILQIPVLVLTGSQNPDDIAAAYEAGANSYLVKPLGFPDLVEMARAIRQFWLVQNTFAAPLPEIAEAKFRVLPATSDPVVLPAAMGI